MKILIVEDHQDLCDALADILIDMEFEVDTCLDGESAYQKIATNFYDFIISDIKMPKLNDIELVQKLNQQGVRSKIILMTGYADINEEEVLAEGADYFF
jgi:two-component system OmpR family response regulator